MLASSTDLLMDNAVVPSFSATGRQVTGMDASGQVLLAVLAKRTYQVTPQGRCVPAEEQVPLVDSVTYDPESPERLAQETDLFPFKLATDIVVQGHAHSPTPVRELTIAVAVEGYVHHVRVIGDRRCERAALGGIVFSLPEPFVQMPMAYDRAFGGRDEIAERKWGNPYEVLQPFVDRRVDLSRSSPFLYPRNPAGRGYVIEANAEAVEAVRLPNLERPDDLLTPDRLAVGDPLDWPKMPIPAGTDWVDHAAFPRIAFLGLLPDCRRPAPPLPEALRGLVPSDLLDEKPMVEKLDYRFANGASLGLTLPYLRGDEACRLTYLHPRYAAWRVELPGERPRLSVDDRKGGLRETDPVIHTVLFEPDENRVSILWRGSAPALRPYMPEELQTMPFGVYWPTPA